MSYDRYRAANRWAISTTLLIWIIVHGLSYFEPMGVTAQTTRVLAIGGLILIPLMAVLSWLRGNVRQLDDDRPKPTASEFRTRTLICFEVVMLSAASMLLLTLIPS